MRTDDATEDWFSGYLAGEWRSFIDGWRLADRWVRAMTEGVTPGDLPLYPVVPRGADKSVWLRRMTADFNRAAHGELMDIVGRWLASGVANAADLMPPDPSYAAQKQWLGAIAGLAYSYGDGPTAQEVWDTERQIDPRLVILYEDALN